nr:MAG TPA: hypothetical protein [Caudoviricetes sp.]
MIRNCVFESFDWCRSSLGWAAAFFISSPQ